MQMTRKQVKCSLKQSKAPIIQSRDDGLIMGVFGPLIFWITVSLPCDPLHINPFDLFLYVKSLLKIYVAHTSRFHKGFTKSSQHGNLPQLLSNVQKCMDLE